MVVTRSSKNSCKACTKRVISHKTSITCSICYMTYHPKCAHLTPSDITELTGEWSCYNCNSEILPVGAVMPPTPSGSEVNLIGPIWKRWAAQPGC